MASLLDSGIFMPTFHAVSLILGIGMFTSGVVSALNPIPYSEHFGLPIRKPSENKASVVKDNGLLEKSGSGWVTIFAGRELTLGSTILILNYLGEVNALSVLISALYFTAAGDILGNIRFGMPGAYKPHLYMSIFALWVGPAAFFFRS